MNKLLTILLLCAAPLVAGAQQAPAAAAKPVANPVSKPASDDPADAYFDRKNPRLTAQDKEALAIAQRWQTGAASGVKPHAGAAGAVRFIYGVQQASIVCAVLQVCDIALQAGEQVNNLHVGDPRFTVEPAVSGAGATEVQHLILKPLDVGLQTNLVVTTSRRTYHIRLSSHRTEFMPQVSFTYPEEDLARWEAARTREKKEQQERTMPQTGEYLGDLNFQYQVTGSAPWKPVRVFNDGVKTVIQMPAAMAQTEAPALLVVRREGGWFSSDETVMVNYRIQGDRYIVDTVFDKAVLIAGVGRDQDRITITRGK